MEEIITMYDAFKNSGRLDFQDTVFFENNL